MFHKKSYLLVLILLLVIAACTPTGAEPDATPEDDTAEQVAPEAIPAARQTLAEFLGIAPDVIEMAKVEDAEWGDACLGLGGPAESCAAVVTPGYAITFTVDGDSYTVRTDLTGDLARVETAVEEAPMGDDLPPAVTAAQAALAQELGIELAMIKLVNFEQREWSDGCLGLGGPAESCLAAITPGWLVELEANGQLYEVRSDLNGDQVRIADDRVGQPAGDIPSPDLNGSVIFYQRSGGLDGQLLTVRIYADGTIERAMGAPSPEMPVETAVVDPAAVETLMNELSDAGYFGLERTYLPEDTCCDRYLYLISVQGDEGQQTVEALEATDGVPDALGVSVDLIETLISESFNG